MDAETCAAAAASLSESLVPRAAEVQATRAERPALADVQRFSAGYVDAGLFGIILLLASGTYLGVRASGLKRMLEAARQLAQRGIRR